MTRIMAMIGDFPFTIEKKPFNKFSRTKEYNFAEIPKVNYYTGEQSIGKDTETLNISGQLITIRSGLNPLEKLYQIADKKQSVPFIFGYGEVLGDFKIIKVQEDNSLFLEDGKSVKVDFSIEMKRVRE